MFLVGIDLVEIPRIEKAFSRFPLAFPDRLATEEELSYYQGKSKKRLLEGIASLFASKEAIRKLYLQKGRNPSWKEIRLLHTKTGAPLVEVSPSLKPFFSLIKISLSHTSELVIAVAVGWERRENES